MGWSTVGTLCLLTWFCSVVALKPRPPSRTDLLAQDYFNDYLTAECSASGNPKPNITWMKDGKEIDINQDRVHLTKQNWRINITRATILDEGSYYCVVNNTHGTSRSKAQRLVKASLNSFPTLPSDTVTGYVGKHLALECRERPQSQPTHGLSDYNWFIGKSKQIDKTSRLTVDQNGALHFLPLKEEDEPKYNATYNCSVHNAETRTRVYGSPTVLFVKKGEEAALRNPTFVYTSKDVNVNKGGRLELQCIADGNPSATLEWETPKGSPTEKHKIDTALYSLTIDKVELDDGGTYVCTAWNSEGEVGHRIKVSVIAELVSHISPEAIVVPEGVHQGFKCEVTEEEAEIKWFINNEPVKEGEKIVVEGNTLTINNLKRQEDMLSVQCHVTKDKRAHVSDATLTVINETQFEASPEPKVYIPRRNRTDLYVEATVDSDYQSELSYSWFLNGRQLDRSLPGINFYMANGVSRVTIDTSDIDDQEFRAVQGVYECEMSIGAKAATKRAKFVVISADPRLARAATAGTDGNVWWVGLIVAVLLCVVVVLIVYLAYRNKGGVYPVDKRERSAGRDPVKELEEDQMKELTRTESEYHEDLADSEYTCLN